MVDIIIMTTKIIMSIYDNFSGVMRAAQGVVLFVLIFVFSTGAARADGAIVCMASTSALSSTQYVLADCGVPLGSSAMVELTGHNMLTLTTYITLTEQSQHCVAPVPRGFSNICAVQVNDGVLDLAQTNTGYEVRVNYTFVPIVTTETLKSGDVVTSINDYPPRTMMYPQSSTVGDGNILVALVGLIAIQVLWNMYLFFFRRKQ